MKIKRTARKEEWEMVSTRSYLILLFSFKVIFPNIKIKNVNIDFFFFFNPLVWLCSGEKRE